MGEAIYLTILELVRWRAQLIMHCIDKLEPYVLRAKSLVCTDQAVFEGDSLNVHVVNAIKSPKACWPTCINYFHKPQKWFSSLEHSLSSFELSNQNIVLRLISIWFFFFFFFFLRKKTAFGHRIKTF